MDSIMNNGESFDFRLEELRMEALKLPAVLENLNTFVGFAHSGAASFGLNNKKITAIELALEEALVNIFNYAYPEGGGLVEVRFGPRNEKKFVVEIVDEGMPFDPLSCSDPDVTQGVEEREIGGLGILLIKEMADHVEYRRENTMNVLTFLVSKE